MKVQDRNAGNLLTIEKLTAGYGTRSVISGVELSISAGEIVTVIGANGVGKTTLLRTAAGLIPPLEGRILIAGEDISAMSEARRARLLALCLTERMDADRMNGFEVVSMGRYPYTGRFGTLREEDRRKVTEVMEQVGIGALAKMPFPTM
ncbi:MAG: ABC transporter ATP-binding protein, partial [Lachnospiraceae bacterium]|nr:ABC transporter ATP-binding protein [Lachnospiraceae bacterium]